MKKPNLGKSASFMLVLLLASCNLACEGKSDATSLPGPGTAAEAKPAASLLITTDVACAVSVDGGLKGELVAHETKKVEVAPGEHLVVAVSADARRFEEVVQVTGEQKVVKVRFPEAARKKPTPTAKPATSAPPAAPLPPPATPPPPPAAAPPPAADLSRVYRMTIFSASIFPTPSNGDPNATFSEDVPPDAAFVVVVDGVQVHSSVAPLNTYDPQWNESFSFYATRSTRVQIGIFEVDLFKDARSLAQWDGTVGDLLTKGGTVRFGVIKHMSYVLE